MVSNMARGAEIIWIRRQYMRKNKSKRRVRTDYAARASAMRRLDHELTKGHRAK